MLITSGFLLFIYCFPYPRSKAVAVLKYLPLVATVLFGLWIFIGDSFLGEESITLKQGILQTQPEAVGIWVWSVFVVLAWLASVIELIRRYLKTAGVDED